MAIDYVIQYDCLPRQELTTDGIIERLKSEERARTIIDMFRRNGDDRPPSEMGFEFTRSTPEGQEETRLIIVQDLLDKAAQLQPLAHHCQSCPANRAGKPYGCVGFIQYPISQAAEKWMMDRLPVPDETLVWLLLRQGVKEFQYDGTSVQPLRDADNIYFEESQVFNRRLGEFDIDSNQLFEMIFAVGNINPNHAALLLLFMHAIPRDLEASTIMNIAPAPPDLEQHHPFLLKPDPEDDDSISELKAFFYALYLAWKLDVYLILDV
jgi:hypothetical protein